jgi:hypothetical protein
VGDAIYRDPFLAARSRVRELELAVADREARVTEALLQHVPQELAARIRAAGGARGEVDHDAPLDTLSRAEAELVKLRDALDEAIALAPRLEAELTTLSEEAPALPPPRRDSWAHSLFASSIRDELHAAAARLGQLVVARDPGARVVSLGRGAVGAQFRAIGAPFAIVAEPRTSDILMSLSTPMRVGTPALRVRDVGLVRTRRPLGDPAFDDLFEAEGDDAARALLVKPVRNALVELAHFDVPTLVVSRGIAALTWRFDPVPKAVDCAAHALARLREVEIELRLLR